MAATSCNFFVYSPMLYLYGMSGMLIASLERSWEGPCSGLYKKIDVSADFGHGKIINDSPNKNWQEFVDSKTVESSPFISTHTQVK